MLLLWLLLSAVFILATFSYLFLWPNWQRQQLIQQPFLEDWIRALQQDFPPLQPA